MTQTATTGEGLRATSAYLSQVLGADVIDVELVRGELSIRIKRESIVKVLTTLHDDARVCFNQLTDLCGVDYPERPERFEVVYHVLSMSLNQRLRLRVEVGDGVSVPSVAGVYPCADWLEREVWDLFGIYFTDHPDLRRILTDYGFEGHPLRKDFPLTGYVEMRYDEEQKRVIYEPVKLAQDFRSFDFLSPWEGIQKVLPGDEKATDPAVAPPSKQGGA